MNTRDVEQVAAALLYEGYMLYPYRPSATKNRQRFNFGVVSPAGDDGSMMQTECLVLGTGETTVGVTVRWLQLFPGAPLQSAVEREVRVPPCPLRDPASTTQFAWPPIDGAVAMSARRCEEGVYKVCVRVVNWSPRPAADREELLAHSLVSTHTILRVSNGDFVSLTDAPDSLQQHVSECHNIRTWPVLAGEPGQRTTMLSSPVILYDYPEIAAESAGNLFDGTEIDEILSLRILTLTDSEQQEVRSGDERARRLLERTQSLTAEDFARMHGVMRRADAEG